MSDFNKRHYTYLAACIGAAFRWADDRPEVIKGIQDLANRIELELELDNPKFNQAKFADAVEAAYSLGAG